ncbi:glutamate synthase subunit beta [Sediminispirochaeta smaragdinae]|jgi:glutamate synthase (NADPH/NADH) small chain|uniref:Glutamate synthase, NADH/NADPH, small subunit n=1 Tax=Sediminispirochaeta smaragdinae (strain DSM 11293 / JCM 15392 / SEBR 4228) TaxID=573413 RepID=E1R1R5_SEDSS|nr:glutamate synthase subunit beta [Sediminispirochaeta smaragdinae]ADK81441.1 glutamate synthase, NADH/NADPH, small subunit [Sediminispirochaeta smaragdinae DSM 11293]
MGELLGFLKYQRQIGGYRDVNERVRDYHEVMKNLEYGRLRQQAARCMDCGTPFCHALGCPLGNIIPEFNDMVYRGLWREAYDRLELTNNFPEVTGRICPATCESSCTLSINDAPVTIRAIELAIIEMAFENGWVLPQPPRHESGKKVAVVGSGPSGLAAAQQLRRMGHKVTVYEQSSKPGGLLRYGIPEFKLEKRIIDRRLEILQKEGIEFETGVTVGVDISARYLKRKHDAVVLALGSREPRKLPVPGIDNEGIYFALDYLTSVTKHLHGEISDRELISAKGKKVLVIGGGDTGADCVGTANRQGAEKVYQFEIMPKPREWHESWNPQWPDYPRILRTSSSHEEGSDRRWSIKTKQLYGMAGVNVEKGIFCDLDDQLKEVPGTEFTLELDMVLIAAGFVHVEHSRLIKDFAIGLDKQGNIAVDDGLATNTEGIFAAGDAVQGASLVVKAIDMGRRVSDVVDRYLC